MISPRTLHTFEMEAAELPAGDWTAHRELAQSAVEFGYAAELTQEVSNDAADPTPLTHQLRFLEPDAVDVFTEGIQDVEDAMGGSVSVEQFTPDRPHGYFGQRTPLEFSPNQEDWPDIANVRLSHGGKESVHSTLTQALETVLGGQNDLAWIPPKDHSQFDSDGPLRIDNESPVLLDSDGAVVAEHVLDALRVVAASEGQRITIGTGREDAGAVFSADFGPDGHWSLGRYGVEDSHTMQDYGSLPSYRVTGEFSDALETHVEYQGRVTREDEHSAFEEAQSEGKELASRLLTPSDEVGAEAQDARLAHAESFVADYEARLDAAYANAPSSTQEPDVGPEPDLEKLVVAHAGDVQAAVRSEDFASVVQQTLGKNPHERFINDEDGQRFETWLPSEDDHAHIATVVDTVRKRVGAEAVDGLPTKSPVTNAVDTQAMSSFEKVLKNRPQSGPKAGLRASAQQTGQAFRQSEPLSQAKNQDHGLAGEPPF